MGFANLDRLENNLASLQSNLSSYKSKLSNKKKRKTDVESIIKNIKRVTIYKSDDLNTYLNNMINNYEHAIKGVNSVASLISETRKDKEKDSSVDADMGNAVRLLNSELRDIEDDINNLKNKIDKTNSSITSCQSAIRAEKRSIAIEYRNNYNSMQAKVNAAEAAYKADPTSAQLKQAYNKACRNRDTAKAQYNKYRGWL